MSLIFVLYAPRWCTSQSAVITVFTGWTVAYTGYRLQIASVPRQLNGQSKIPDQGGAARSTEAAEQTSPREIQRQVST
jgi:hypothetical protein